MNHLQEYRVSLQRRGYQPTTVRNRVLVASWLPEPTDVDADAMLAVLDRTRRASTRRCYAATMRAVWSDWLLLGWVDGLWPLAGWRMPRPPRPEPQPYSDAELLLLLGMREPMRSWTVLGAFAGLRVSEVFRLRRSDFDGRRVWVDGKGGRRASVPAHPMVADVMGSWRPVGYADANSVTRIWQQYARQVGVVGTFHRLRHTFATRLLESGADLATVSAALRHSDLKSTAHYVRVADRRLVDAVAVL